MIKTAFQFTGVDVNIYTDNVNHSKLLCIHIIFMYIIWKILDFYFYSSAAVFSALGKWG